MGLEDKIIKAMHDEGKPMSAGQITDKLAADRKEVDKVMNKLKKEEKIVSPKRCYWEPK